MANLPFTRRGRRAAAQRDKDRSHKDGTPQDPMSASSTNDNTATEMNDNTMGGPSPTIQPQSGNMFGSAVSMLAPLPGQVAYTHPTPQNYGYPPAQFGAPMVHPTLSHDRWENMATLFHSIRDHARGFEYPSVSVAALETVLIRLYLESPVALGTNMGASMQGGIVQSRPPPAPSQAPPAVPTSTTVENVVGGESEDG